ncbi:hypothetical protein A9Q89_02410, partial [Gammaproteobacteria bacterium 53_120_T64]
TSFENFQAAIHPDDRLQVNRAIENCIQHDMDYDIEHRIVWPDGSVHWAHESGDVIRNASGVALRMLGVVQDITQRKAVELGLAEEQRRLKEAQQIGAIGDWSLKFADDSMHYSDEAARIVGQLVPADGFELSDIFARINPQDRQAIALDNKEVLKLGQSKVNFRIHTDQGLTRWVQTVRSVMRDPDDNIIGFRGTVQDISARKAAEQQQLHSHRVLEKIAQDAPLADTLALLIEQAEAIQVNRLVAILAVDPVSEQLYCQAAPSLPSTLVAALHALKIDTQQLPQQANIIEHISQHSDWQDLRQISTAANCFICCARSIESSCGQLLGLLLIYSPEPNSASNESRSLSNDLSHFAAIALEQKQSLWTLMEAKEDAVQANRVKSQFLSRISHDLRTPLNAIMGFGQLLDMDNSAPLSQRQRRSVAEINKASEYLLELIDDILKLAEIESEHLELHLEAIDVAELLAECAALITPLAIARDIDIRPARNRDGQANSHIQADRKCLKQVLLNLLSNAVKYNHHGGSIFPHYQSTDQGLRILITDSGPGLSVDQQSKLFTPFERLGAENSGVKGSGIGLVIAKSLVENMAGTIGLDSKLGSGSTFWIALPRAPAPTLPSTSSSLSQSEKSNCL